MCWLFSVFFRFAFLPVEGTCSLYSDQSLPALVVSNGATSHTHLSWIVYPHLSVGSFHLDIQTLFQNEFTNHPHLTSPQISISLWHPTPVLLPRKSHGWRSLVGCSPWGRKELDTTEWLHFHFSLSCIGEGNGNPLQCSCLENPRDGGAWWAALCGVEESWTRLKWLSSSSSIPNLQCSGCPVWPMSPTFWSYYNGFFFLRFFFFWCGLFLKSLLTFFYNIASVFMFWFICCEACGISSPQPGIEPAPPAFEGKVLTTGLPGKSL